ncbi:MAG TPA: hypothetical protein VF166_13950 [Gemmatimonadaceae bacterium]
MRSYLVVVVAATLGFGCASSNQGDPPPEAAAPQSIYVRTPDGQSLAIAGISTEAKSATAIAVDVPIETSWKVLPDVYHNLGIAVVAADPASHTLGNHEVKLSRRLGSDRLSSFFDCGKGLDGYPHADEYAVTVDLLTQVTPGDDNGSMIRTQVLATATPVSGLASDPVQCTSTGKLEHRIADLVKADAGS